MALTDEDKNGLKEMRELYNEFLQNQKGSKSKDELVKMYLSEAIQSDAILLPFLRGRKYRTQYAWETLKRNAEVRFKECPELFPQTIPKKTLAHIQDRNIFGLLKIRDGKGRHVIICNGGAWDPDICSLEDLMVFFIPFVKNILTTKEDATKHGIVYIQECSGQGFKHYRQYSITAIRKLIKVFWHSFPVQLKTVHYANVPTLFHYTFSLAKPFLPRKLKERLIVSPLTLGFQETHQLVPSDNLPTFLGGSLSFREAIDESIIIV